MQNLRYQGEEVYTTSPPKKFLPYNKTQNSQRVKVHEKSYTKFCHSLTYSLTLTHTRFRKISKIILFIHIKSIYSFFLDAWLFLSPLLRYVETHSAIGVVRTLHKWSTICFASSNNKCLGICTTKRCLKLIWPSDCNWTRTQNHLVLKRTLNHLAKLEWLSVCLRTKWLWVPVQLQSLHQGLLHIPNPLF